MYGLLNTKTSLAWEIFTNQVAHLEKCSYKNKAPYIRNAQNASREFTI